MGRKLRPNLAGVPFHLTARIQAHERHFVDFEEPIVRLIRATVAHSDVRLLAYAVMSNHLHIVVVQGVRQLADFMQPLLRSIALRVLSRLRRGGHVFERRFDARPLLDPRYFRNAIAYVHLNPVRAGICAEPQEYPWTSLGEYLRPRHDAALDRVALEFEGALRVFARSSRSPLDHCRADHLAFLRWRLAMDSFLAAAGRTCTSWDDGNDDGNLDSTTDDAPLRPDCTGGDIHWNDQLAAYARAARASGFDQPPPREDMSRIACTMLADEMPRMSLDLLRCGSRTRHVVRVRKRVIARLHVAGYKNYQIARFLRVTGTTVSKVTTTMRPPPPA